jgi:glycolate oxidase iron-sulfur subunit
MTPQEALDRCVKCGMCLPECPTYRLERNENESPRGRLALMEGLLQGRLPGDATLTRHLDNCLGCRRCERVCPSLVPYGRLLDLARERLAGGRPRRLAALIQDPALQHWGTQLARLAPMALSRPLRSLHGLHRLATALPATANAPPAGDYPPLRGTPRGRVGLFLGCATAAQQGGALQSALRLLRYAGFTVSIPADAGCCGALSMHSGDPGRAARLAATNRAAFDLSLDAVVSIASGCGIHLDDYRPPLPTRHLDINRFLREQGDLRAADFAPLADAVLVHTPCSMENVYRGGGWVDALLSLIPELRLRAVGEAGQCCGSAGDYMLRHPALAERLRAPILDATTAHTARILLTSNVGCAMHLAAGLRAQGADIEVLHPVELLARQLRATWA